VLLQSRGAAGFVVLTTPFADQIERQTAYYQIDRPLPAIVLDHPVQNISPAVREQRAQQLAEQVSRLLRGETPRPE
jgi:hypothetical protein